MRTNTLALALAGILVAGGASAQGLSAAQVQLSAQAGVAPGTYSVAQLYSTVHQSDENTAAAGLPASSVNAKAVAASEGAQQLAEQAGVNAADYTDAQLAYLATVAHDPEGNVAVAAADLNKDQKMDAAHLQMAEWLGVDASKYKPTQITAMWMRAHD